MATNASRPLPSEVETVTPDGQLPDVTVGAVRVFDLGNGKVVPQHGIEAVRTALERPDSSLWIDLTDPDPETIEEAARLLGLHPLIAGDIERRNQRPKVAIFDDAIHIVMFRVDYHTACEVSEIDLVLGRRYLLSVHERSWDPKAVDNLHRDAASKTTRGPDFVLWALLDAIVDDYFPAIDRLGDEIDDLQDEVIRRPSPDVLQHVFQLKRELLTMRRSVTPARDLLNVLTNRDLPFILPRHLVYFRDVYDHLIRVTDEIDTDRDLIGGTLDAYLSTVNNNLSLIMKRLTGVTVILAGAGAVAGIFGMSEAGIAFQGVEAGGFWLVTAAIVALAGAAAYVLHRIDWI
jgi:magnesium transporter